MWQILRAKTGTKVSGCSFKKLHRAKWFLVNEFTSGDHNKVASVYRKTSCQRIAKGHYRLFGYDIIKDGN